eukprot:COSAG05_NODE_1342_length_5140_cov_2.897838_3_plen_113_part_00
MLLLDYHWCVGSLREWKWETSEWIYSTELKAMLLSYFFGCVWLLTFIDAVQFTAISGTVCDWCLPPPANHKLALNPRQTDLLNWNSLYCTHSCFNAAARTPSRGRYMHLTLF